jgi:hypothetical protein
MNFNYDVLNKYIENNPRDNNGILGCIGELIVKSIIEESLTDSYHDVLEHLEVNLSKNKYDSEKDMCIHLKCADDPETVVYTVEVKTEMPFMVENAMTIKENQFRKCSTVDNFIFVEVPNKTSGYKCNIYEVEDAFKHKTRKTKDGRKMFLYPKNELKLLTTIDDPDIIELLNKYNMTEWRQK